MAISDRCIESWFGEHLVQGLPEKVRGGVDRSRNALKFLAETVLKNTPIGAEQTRAITRLRDTLDAVISAAWESEVPAARAGFGNHWLRGVRHEQQDHAQCVLQQFADAADTLIRESPEGIEPRKILDSLRGAREAAFRSIRCFV
jgi:hypothetical protein